MEPVKVDIPVCHDTFTDHQSILTIIVLADNVRGPISTTQFFPDESRSRVFIQTEARLITEENLLSIILCPIQADGLTNLEQPTLNHVQSDKMSSTILADPTRALQATNWGSGPVMEEFENDVGSLEQLLLYSNEHYLAGNCPWETILERSYMGSKNIINVTLAR
ncbi:15-hydroxyprostaglandin dehydrogenase [Trichonephila clavipes]|nr:15-hydroxyprostaglandin dehydrogenase [Trichonephila clavipes]